MQLSLVVAAGRVCRGEGQGEDKPSPLPWTNEPAKPLSVIEGNTFHGRGDGLSSPCWRAASDRSI
ncbi:MAG TPA: hypothetical protein VK140_16415 [Ktedonobacteraceae bacterium]|nr:hypothetical protein [Ktedonobacteraceae bacterium]